MANAFNQSIYSKGAVTYSDIDLSFTPNPLTGDIYTKTDVDALKQAIYNLLFIKYGDIPFVPNLGCSLDSMLFRPLDSITVLEVKASVVEVITNFEPRALINSLYVTEDGSNTLNISLSISMINISTPVTFTLVLRRTR